MGRRFVGSAPVRDQLCEAKWHATVSLRPGGRATAWAKAGIGGEQHKIWLLIGSEKEIQSAGNNAQEHLQVKWAERWCGRLQLYWTRFRVISNPETLLRRRLSTVIDRQLSSPGHQDPRSPVRARRPQELRARLVALGEADTFPEHLPGAWAAVPVIIL